MEIARVFLDVSMANGHDGLMEIMRKARINPETLPSEQFVIFINRKQTAFKLYVGKQYLVHHKTGSNRPFPLEAIANFPEFFDGRRLDFDKAVKKTLESKLRIQQKLYA